MLDEQREQERLEREAADRLLVADFIKEITSFTAGKQERFLIRRNEERKRAKAIADLESRRQKRRNEINEGKLKNRRIW